MDFMWYKMPDEYSMRRKTPFNQVKAVVESLNNYEKLLHQELKKVTRAKAEISMILVSEDYANKVLNESSTNGQNE